MTRTSQSCWVVGTSTPRAPFTLAAWHALVLHCIRFVSHEKCTFLVQLTNQVAKRFFFYGSVESMASHLAALFPHEVAYLRPALSTRHHWRVLSRRPRKDPESVPRANQKHNPHREVHFLRIHSLRLVGAATPSASGTSEPSSARCTLQHIKMSLFLYYVLSCPPRRARTLLVPLYYGWVQHLGLDQRPLWRRTTLCADMGPYAKLAD
ncbi:hypothetical protein F4808DRAFT_318303 [Astrocystis sublimbata]|nr:hypothetical protein F4808DRAFT_318303 [Astrocystis sublimbata]